MKLITLYFTITLSIIGGGIVYSQENEVEENRVTYDYRTRLGVYASGSFLDLVGNDHTFGETPFAIGRSSSTEFGIIARTRLFEESDIIRLKYGLAIQWNKLSPRGNKYMVDEDGINILEEFPLDLKKNQLRFTNLVVPLYIEFGPSKKFNDHNYVTFSKAKQFKIGLGGFVGLNIGSMQKLKYKDDGVSVKNKIKRDYNTTGFVYGVGAYVGYDILSLFAKYDLSPLFKNQPEDLHLLSLGLRVDLD